MQCFNESDMGLFIASIWIGLVFVTVISVSVWPLLSAVLCYRRMRLIGWQCNCVSWVPTWDCVLRAFEVALHLPFAVHIA
jgi:hypothetical protein